MSFQITTSFVQEYATGIEMLVQQGASRLRSTVQEERVHGKSEFFDQIGTVEAQKITTRHGDSPLNPTPHARRRLTTYSYDVGDLVDKMDLIRTLNDPTNPYVRAQAAAMGRAIDREIFSAFWGTAYTGEDGTTTVTTGWNEVAVNSWAYGTGTGNSGLTISKLIEGKVKLWGAEAVDSEFNGGEPIYMAVTAAHLGQLLQTTEVTSSDFNTVKALVNGEVNNFMGINFRRTELVPYVSSTYLCPMYVPSAMKLGIGMDVTNRIAERADKRFSVYAYTCMDIGATRMQESKLVKVITT